MIMVGIIFMGQKYCVNNNSQTSEPDEFVNLLIIGLQAKMSVKPLSPLYIWVHIIENEIWFYRKRDYLRW